MVEKEVLAGKIFALLKGNGLQIKIFDAEGAETTDPNLGRRFFIMKPNLMVTINEDSNTVEFNKGRSEDGIPENPIIGPLQKNIRKLADEFLMNTDIKIFGKDIQPTDFAYEAKNKKGAAMNESINSQLLGRVLKELDYAAGMTAEALSANIPGSDLNQVQQVLNKLASEGKVETMDMGD
ncbi:MAG TPA: hypothetical protein VIY47_15510, partial [Ignavibacteriaceae bacterium]